jgi:hypothetical protein
MDMQKDDIITHLTHDVTQIKPEILIIRRTMWQLKLIFYTHYLHDITMNIADIIIN